MSLAALLQVSHARSLELTCSCRATTAWTLRDRLVAAVREHRDHKLLLQAFTESLDPSNVAQWTAQIEAWEKDQNLPDPYSMIASGTRPSLHSAR